MIFAQSSPGISHTRFEDTPKPALDRSIRAFLLAVDRTVAHYAAAPAPAAKPARRARALPGFLRLSRRRARVATARARV